MYFNLNPRFLGLFAILIQVRGYLIVGLEFEIAFDGIGIGRVIMPMETYG